MCQKVKECCLDKSLIKEIEKLKRGDEINIETSTGLQFEGILYDLRNGYVHTIGELGVIILFPYDSITKIFQQNKGYTK